MRFRLNHFRQSLRSDRSPDDAPIIPDGVMDASSVIDPLIKLGQHGRALDSSEPHSMGEFIADMLDHMLPPRPRKEDLELAVISQATLIAAILRAVNTIHPDTTPEEVLMVAASQEETRELARDFAATPYVTDSKGLPRPLWSQLGHFSNAQPITTAMLRGFIKRHISPTMKRLRALDLPEDDVDPPDGTPYSPPVEPGFEFFDIAEIDLESGTIDPLNGFDEFDREFFDHEEDYLDGGDDPDLGDEGGIL